MVGKARLRKATKLFDPGKFMEGGKPSTSDSDGKTKSANELSETQKKLLKKKILNLFMHSGLFLMVSFRHYTNIFLERVLN